MTNLVEQALFGQAYRNFADSLKSPATKHAYASLQKYMRHLQVQTVDELLKNIDKPKLIEAEIIEYIVTLRNPPHSLAYQTRYMYLSAIVMFYAMNDVDLNRKKIARYLGEPTMVRQDRAYTTEEILRLLEFCDERQRAIVLLMASTGVRLGSLPLLHLRHLSLVTDYDLYQVTIYANTKDEYYTFTTPEAKRSIDAYLQFRERCGEKLTKDSPLFRQQFDRNDSLDVTHPKPLLRDGVITALDDALLRSGLKIAAHLTEDNCFPGKERKEVGMTKGFRKFAITQMAKSRMDAEIREKLVGHTIGIATHYIRYSPEEMLQEYIKAVDLLTINEENRLRRQVNELASRSDRFADLEGQIKDQEERHKKEMQYNLI